MKHDKEEFRDGVMIIIIDYECLAKRAWEILKYNIKVCIVDEAHVLKSKESYNGDGKIIVKMVSEMKRAIILTGMKLLKKPRNLYYLLRMVRPDLMPGFYEYGYRYCDPRHLMESILTMLELKKILEKRMLIRERRPIVFEELNKNLYQKFEVNGEVQIVVKIQSLIKTFIVPWEE